MPTVVYSFEEEVERRGKPLEIDGELCFPDGSTASRSDGTLTNPPPADDYRRLKRIRKYWLTIFDRAFEDFNAIRAACLGQRPPFRWRSASWGPHPGDERASLFKLKDVVEGARRKLNEIDAAIMQTPQAILEAKILVAEVEADLYQEKMAKELADRVKDIELDESCLQRT